MHRKSDKMKKRIINIIEIAIQIVALIFFFCIVATDRDGYTNPLYEFLARYPLYYIPIYTLWGINFVMCLVSAISKNKKKDGKIHSTVPILIFILNMWFMFGVANRAENNMHICFAIAMFVMIIVSFVKRANVFNDTVQEVKVVNAKESNADELKKYKELLDAGTITQEEFESKKKQLLGL